MRKAWEALFLFAIFLFALHMVMAAIKPFLPLLGFAIVVMLTIALWRIIVSRRKFW